MLGKKRTQSGRTRGGRGGRGSKFRMKTTEERVKNHKNDEDIMSESEDEAQVTKDDDFFEEDVPKESADEKRLRLAKKLINQIGDDLKERGDERGVDEYLKDEMKKEEKDNYIELSSNLNPVEVAFRKGHKNAITSIDIASDNSFAITTSKDTRLIKWDLNTDKKYLMPIFSKRPLLTGVITADDKYAFVGGADKYIYQVDLHNEKVVQSLRAHNDSVTGIIFDKTKDQFYSCSKDNTLKVWAMGTNYKSIMTETFYGHTDKILDIDRLSGNRLITSGFDKQINIWKIDAQSFLQFKVNELYSVDTVRGLNNSCFLSGSEDGGISLWRTNKKKPIFTLPNCHGFNKKLKLNHPFFNNRSLNHLELEYSNPILALECVKNSDLLFSGSVDGNLNFYKYLNDSNTIEPLKTMELHKSCINVIKVSNNHEFLIASNSKEQKFGRWDIAEKGKSGISIIKLFDQ